MYNLTKTFTFALVHFTVAFSVTYALTGSWVLGGLIALIEPALNTVAYFFHERAWARWGDSVRLPWNKLAVEKKGADGAWGE